MIINLSNHPSDKWDEKQKEAARQYGEIKDLPFPKISSQMKTEDIHSLADIYFNECKSLLKPYNKSNCAIHLAGELTFCYYLTNKLVSAGYIVITATTERIVEMKDNVKTSVFNFLQFREFKKRFPRVPPMIIESVYCHKYFSYFMLILSFIVEKIVLDAINIISYEHDYSLSGHWRPICVGIFIIYIVLFFIGWYYQIYQANTSTMRKLLNYTIGFRLISVCIAISFLCQITWFMDAAFPLFLGTFNDGVLSCKNSWYSIFQLIVIVGFMYSTFALFHVFTWMAKKRIILKEERTLLVSGFSNPNSNSLDLFTKLFSDYKNLKTVIILLSNTTFSSEFACGINDTKKDFKEYMPFIDNIQLIKDYNNAVIAFKKDKISEQQEEQKQQERNIKEREEEYKIQMQKLFRSIIKASIDKVNPSSYKEKTIDIHFTKEVNYNKFDNIYEALSESLKTNERNNDRGTLINISPGTAMVAGALTAFAIKGNRQLVYCNQDGKKTMEESTVNVWTLNEILKELWSEIEESSES